ncbi:MAG: hypothetical protein QOG14_4287 [Mycobacterium sp.]|jgi:hypothetical protein|nr:hypothetical protein [Mycobacterium sp.]
MATAVIGDSDLYRFETGSWRMLMVIVGASSQPQRGDH